MTTEWKVVNSPSPVPTPTELSHGFAIQAPSSFDLWETPTGPVFTSPMIYQSIPLGSFHRARVTITADLKELYGQGGLALIIHRPDAARAWVKAGVEFINGEQLVCVVGRDRLPDSSLGTSIMASSDGNAEVTIEMTRDDTGLAVFEIQAEGSGPERKRVIREMAWVFAGSGDEECWIGAYAAKPLGDAKDPDMVTHTMEYSLGLQYVSNDTPIEDIVSLMKRDGAVVVRNLVSTEVLDKTYDEVKERINQDLEWDGAFFPKEKKRAPSLIARSPTYTKTQVMNPLFQSVCAYFLTTRNTFWWGDELKESVSKPQITSCVAIKIGPGAKAQPLHRDSYIHHRVVPKINEWDDERDRDREPTIGMLLAGCKVTRGNGGTRLIPGSHLWATVPSTPPAVEEAIVPELDKGDAIIMFSSVFHGGGSNITSDQHRLVYSTFAVRGYLRQEENQYLAVPRDIVKQYDKATQEFIGYYISEPAGGWVEELDPYYTLYPEKLRDAKLQDF